MSGTDVSPSIALPGEMLRMMYAMAIMRLVNGVMDQSVRRNTSSVANRAEDARLPCVFVDIRHETARNELPSLLLVRHASKQALTWLLRNYWEEQEQLLQNTQNTRKAKLIEHAQVMYEILVAQQRLLSKKVRTQDYKLQRLTLKNALKGIKRQQQGLLKELLELTDSGTCEFASLLV